MKEKFIYPLLAILLAMISTNVSAKVTTDFLQFEWEGSIPITDGVLDWEFVDMLGMPYTPKGPAFFRPTAESNEDMKILGNPISVFIAPKKIGTHTINEVSASLMKRPTVSGLVNNENITNATNITTITANQVAIIINNTLMMNDPTSITKTDDNFSRFEVSIILKALIPKGNYTRGKSITFSVPILFSVDIVV